MKSNAFVRFSALIATASVALIAQTPVYDPASLAAELRRLSKFAAAGDSERVRSALPSDWEVSTPAGVYRVSSEPLRTILDSADKDPSSRAVRLADARIWLDHHAGHLESSLSAAGTTASARASLDRILRRPEFARLQPPGAWEQLRQRIAEWLARILQVPLGFVREHPAAGRALFWLLSAGAAGMLAWWVFRLWSRDAPFALAPPALTERAPPTWQEWLFAARRSAASDPRQAIHSAYWAGIIYLQQSNMLPRDLTRTPREYLAAMRSGESAGPIPPLESLSALTSNLERFWYARRPVSENDVRHSLTHLEALGCRVD